MKIHVQIGHLFILCFTAILYTISLPMVASACHPGPFNETEKANADVVFVGKPIGYKLLKSNKRKNQLSKKAYVTFEVTKTLKGKNKKSWMFSISPNIDTDIPKSFDQFKKCYGEESEVGLKWDHEGKEIPSAIQGPCHAPYILPIGKPKPSICLFSE